MGTTARQAGASLGTWTEDPVNNTYPYPGIEQWYISTSYHQLDNTLWDPTTGIAINRDEGAYTNPEFGTSTRVAADGNYMVII